MTKFIIEQKLAPVANKYYIYIGSNDGTEKIKLLAFAQQKRFAFKEEVIFYTDETKTSVSFRIKAEKALDYHGRFLVADNDNKPLGTIRKIFGSSLLRSTWEVASADGKTKCKVQESNMALAVFRRLWNFVPYLGDLPFFLKYHFDFIDLVNNKLVAKHSKTTWLRDNYILSVHEDELVKKISWQTIVAQAVLLDALQGR